MERDTDIAEIIVQIQKYAKNKRKNADFWINGMNGKKNFHFWNYNQLKGANLLLEMFLYSRKMRNVLVTETQIKNLGIVVTGEKFQARTGEEPIKSLLKDEYPKEVNDDKQEDGSVEHESVEQPVQGKDNPDAKV